MNNWIGAGRLTKNVEVVYTTDGMAIAKYTLAIDRRGKDITDFIPIKCLGKTAEFAEKHLRKGMKVIVAGEIQTGSYKDSEGNMRYTWEVLVNAHEFCEKKGEANNPVPGVSNTVSDDFMDIPEGIEKELPFN